MTDQKTLPCELCEERLPADAAECPACKARRKPCPYCEKPFWHGSDRCPHCGKERPSPETWSLFV